MSQLHPLHFRYGKALYLEAATTEVVHQVEESLKELRESLPVCEELMALLKSRSLRHGQKAALVQKLFHGCWPPLLVRFLCFLIYKHREREFLPIILAFLTLCKEADRIRTAYVTTAYPLAPQEQEKLHRLLQHKLKGQGTVTLELAIDPTLLGGALIRVGDRLLDLSLKSRLKSIEERLSSLPLTTT